MTPFDGSDRIDEEVLAAEIEFCIACGVSGIATPLMVSEFRNLSEDERRLMIRVPVEAARGRVPIVANCAAASAPLAASYARYAVEVGAAAVIAMPPYIQKPDFPAILAYYRAISDAVTVPVLIQNAAETAMTPDQIVTICTDVEHVSWVKEEVPPSPRNVSALLDRKCPAVHGVMGGGGGRPMLDEHARGSSGVMHACEFSDLIQKVWRLLDAGRTDEAGDLFEHLLPALALEGLLGMPFAKEIMIRRGVFSNNRVRGRTDPLDGHDMREIDRVWRRIEPYLGRHEEEA
jgi:4-hydroxy-tetrahydrodipicolinate synthase